VADTIREKIIQDAMTRVALILVANGYNTDIGENPQRALKTQDEGITKTVIVIPRIETTEGVIGAYGDDAHVFPLDLSGVVAFDDDTEDISVVSEQIYGDLVKAMTRRDSAFSTNIESIEAISGGGFEIPKNEEKFAGAIANFEIKYTTKTGDPYTKGAF
jgi:hypothetical protein